MTDESRIQQFEQMASADPENELGHFSLGRAYHEAGRFEDACQCFGRVVDINPQMSKAYQLFGDALEASGKREAAIAVLTRGIAIADEQGDRMPLEAMIERLRSWDDPVPPLAQPVPASSGPAVSETKSSEGFRCCRCGRPSGQLEKPPFKGDLGQRIYGHVCNGCWREWIPMGTKVINELGLSLSSQAGQDTYDQYMVEFLQLEDV